MAGKSKGGKEPQSQKKKGKIKDLQKLSRRIGNV